MVSPRTGTTSTPPAGASGAGVPALATTGAGAPPRPSLARRSSFVTLPPGRYRVVREGRDGRSTADVEVRSEQVVVVVLRAED